MIYIGDGKLGVTAIIMIVLAPNTKMNTNTNANNDDDSCSNMMAIQSYLNNKYQAVRFSSGECITK